MTENVTWRDYGPAIKQVAFGLFAIVAGLLFGSGALIFDDVFLQLMFGVGGITLVLCGGMTVRAGIMLGRIYQRAYNLSPAPDNVTPLRRS